MARMTNSEKEFVKGLGYSLGLCGVSVLTMVGVNGVIVLPLVGAVFYKSCGHFSKAIKADIEETRNRFSTISFNDFMNK